MTPDALRLIPSQNVFACDPWQGLTEEVAKRIAIIGN